MLIQSAIATPLPCLYYCCCFKNQNPTCLLPKTPFLQNLDTKFYYFSSAKANRGSFFQSGNGCGIKSNKITSPRATLLEAPLIWAGRVCIFYTLLKIGLAGSPANPFFSSGLYLDFPWNMLKSTWALLDDSIFSYISCILLVRFGNCYWWFGILWVAFKVSSQSRYVVFPIDWFSPNFKRKM